MLFTVQGRTSGGAIRTIPPTPISAPYTVRFIKPYSFHRTRTMDKGKELRHGRLSRILGSIVIIFGSGDTKIVPIKENNLRLQAPRDYKKVTREPFPNDLDHMFNK